MSKKVAVECGPALNPETGKMGVLLQLPHGFIIMSPSDARQLASMITLTAEDVESS